MTVNRNQLEGHIFGKEGSLYVPLDTPVLVPHSRLLSTTIFRRWRHYDTCIVSIERMTHLSSAVTCESTLGLSRTCCTCTAHGMLKAIDKGTPTCFVGAFNSCVVLIFISVTVLITVNYHRRMVVMSSITSVAYMRACVSACLSVCLSVCGARTLETLIGSQGHRSTKSVSLWTCFKL